MSKPDNPDNSDNYDVGYGKPPKHSRFNKNQSGNPYGRHKKSKNLKTIYDKVLFESIPISSAGTTSNVPVLEAIVRLQSVKALNGDQRAANTLLKEAATHFPDLAPEKRPKLELILRRKPTECSKCSKDSTKSKDPSKKPKPQDK